VPLDALRGLSQRCSHGAKPGMPCQPCLSMRHTLEFAANIVRVRAGGGATGSAAVVLFSDPEDAGAAGAFGGPLRRAPLRGLQPGDDDRATARTKHVQTMLEGSLEFGASTVSDGGTVGTVSASLPFVSPSDYLSSQWSVPPVDWRGGPANDTDASAELGPRAARLGVPFYTGVDVGTGSGVLDAGPASVPAGVSSTDDVSRRVGEATAVAAAWESGTAAAVGPGYRVRADRPTSARREFVERHGPRPSKGGAVGSAAAAAAAAVSAATGEGRARQRPRSAGPRGRTAAPRPVPQSSPLLPRPHDSGYSAVGRAAHTAAYPSRHSAATDTATASAAAAVGSGEHRLVRPSTAGPARAARGGGGTSSTLPGPVPRSALSYSSVGSGAGAVPATAPDYGSFLSDTALRPVGPTAGAPTGAATAGSGADPARLNHRAMGITMSADGRVVRVITLLRRRDGSTSAPRIGHGEGGGAGRTPSPGRPRGSAVGAGGAGMHGRGSLSATARAVSSGTALLALSPIAREKSANLRQGRYPREHPLRRRDGPRRPLL
jgi:hypothetical protein